MRGFIYIILLLFICSIGCNSQTFPIQVVSDGAYVPAENDEPVLTGYRYVALVFGQSNIDGRIPNDSLPVDVSLTSSKAKILYNSTWSDWDANSPPVVDTPQLMYAPDTLAFQRLSDSLGGETIYVIKNSHGGTSFIQTDDTKGDWNIASTGEHYDELKNRITATRNYIEQVEGRNMVVVGLWIDIGETDSSLGDITAFNTAFDETIDDLLDNQIGDSDLPIYWRKLCTCQAGVNPTFTDNQVTEAASRLNMTLYVDDNQTLVDSYHIDQVTADRYANAIVQWWKNLYENL